MRRFVIVAAVVLAASSAQGAIISWDITVEITTINRSPGFEPWTFGPTTSTGTFRADDTATSSVTDLALFIGGLDIGAVFAIPVGANTWNPTTGVFDWSGLNLATNSLVSFELGVPGSVRATESNSVPPLDPILQNTSNWIGTYNVVQTPEPGSLMLLAIGAVAATVTRRKRRTPR